jgi:HlyD family secretion protein
VERIKNIFSKFKKLVWGHKKISLVALAALIIIGVILWPKGSKTILTETVKIQDVVRTVSVTGKVDSETSVNLTFQFGGKLIYLGAKEGGSIKKGQAIASLDQNQLQATFRQSQQDFTAAKAASDQYYDSHKNATESYDEKVERTALDATQNKAYDQMMKVQQDLNNSTLYSPIDGILTKTGASVVSVNVTAATVFTVTDPKALNFKMEVDEADIGLLRDGQKVIVTLDSFPDDPLRLTVARIEFVSHTTSSGGNAFYVKAKIPDVKNYRVGMSGNADIIVDRKDKVLAIPLSSVTDDNYVYVSVGKNYEKRKVELGIENDTLAEVKSGVQEGEVVAIDPSSIPKNLIKK